ncbi:MAG TPA: methyltransferase [Ktedonobacterales bacterium]|nr:methyltransferase [Ktedonobacterales bacterium]
MLDALSMALDPEQEALYRLAWPSGDLLAETVAVTRTSRVLALGCAADPAVLAVAERVPGGQMLAADDDAAAGERLAAHAARAGMTWLRVADPWALAREPVAHALFDVAVLNTLYHPGKLVSRGLLALAHARLAPGGTLYVAGAKDRGILPIADEVRRLFGNVTTAMMRKGQRVVTALRDATPAAPLDPPGEPATTTAIVVGGETLALTEDAAVFAGGRLDPATAMLIGVLDVAPEDVVADLGCGAGIVGLVAARRAARGHVWLLDASHAAVRRAAANARANAIANVTATAGDALAPLRALAIRPQVIAINPPFHIGQLRTQLVAQRFIAEAAERLAPGGRCYLVANRFLPYERALARHFGAVRELAGDSRYKVLLAEVPLAAAATAPAQ